MAYIDRDKLLKSLPDDLPYKASVKRVLIQAPTADVAPKSEVAREIFEEIDEALAYCLESHPFAISRYNEIRKKYIGE